MFHIATEQDIINGKVTDVYFVRARQILGAEGIDKTVKAEFIVKEFPQGRKWGVLTGIDDACNLLEGKPLNVRGMKEGTIFREYEAVMTIEGKYLDFGIYETALLGLLCQSSGIATKAARCKKTAGNRAVISFGSRRMHPALAPMIERNAFLGGCDGVSVVESAEDLGIEPTGTIPHALVLLMGDTVRAIQAFHKVIDKKVKRVALIDTFEDEKFGALNAAQALGKDLFAVRLDTPASRRGNFLHILKEVRWELNLRGFKDVKLFVSGGIDEGDILKLNEAVDAYGVGTAISNAQVLDFAMDIIEIDGEPIAKRGKMSGEKSIFRCPSCYSSISVPFRTSPPKICKCRAKYENLISDLVKNGKVLYKASPPKEIRDYVLRQLGHYEL